MFTSCDETTLCFVFVVFADDRCDDCCGAIRALPVVAKEQHPAKRCVSPIADHRIYY
jgi:hypothetical protein